MFADVKPIIENTSMQKYIDDKTNKERTYWIKPIEGYEFHASELDSEIENPETGEFEKEIGFTTGIVTCGVRYDFEKNEREFYTREVVIDANIKD